MAYRRPFAGIHPYIDGSGQVMAATATRRAASVLAEWVDYQQYRVRRVQRMSTKISCGICFAFYGRMSTEDYQDYATSRAWQRNAADELITDKRRNYGRILRSGTISTCQVVLTGRRQVHC